MSSNCPPQLQLSIPPSTTSFKRSFEQFGFDLDSPVSGADAGGSGGSNGNDRSKRARSASSFSDASDSLQDSHSSSNASGSGSSSTSVSGIVLHSSTSQQVVSEPPLALGTSLSMSLTHTPLEPPRLPTPDIDVEMPDYPLATDDNPSAPLPPLNLPSPSQGQDNAYRLTLERFNAFETEIAALRRSPTPGFTRSPTLPPTLPPLAISEDQEELNTTSIPFFQTTPQASPIFSRNHDPSSSRSRRSQSPPQPTSRNRSSLQGQEARSDIPRLHIDLPRSSFSLPPPPPNVGTLRTTELAPDFDVPFITGEENLARHPRSDYLFFDNFFLFPGDSQPAVSSPESAASPSVSVSTSTQPPTLPPILTLHDSGTWDEEVAQFHRTLQGDRQTQTPSLTSSSHPGPGPSSSSQPPSARQDLNLRDHVPPSPSLRELRQWMDVPDNTDPFGWHSDAQSPASVPSPPHLLEQQSRGRYGSDPGPSSTVAEASSSRADSASNSTQSRSPEWPSTLSESAWRTISPENQRSPPFLETLQDLEDGHRSFNGRRSPVSEAAVRRLDHGLFNSHSEPWPPYIHSASSGSPLDGNAERRENAHLSTSSSLAPPSPPREFLATRRTSAFRPIEMESLETSERWFRDIGPLGIEDHEWSPERTGDSGLGQNAPSWARRHRLRQPPLRSSNSLVAESASETRRRTDQASLLHRNWASVNLTRPPSQAPQARSSETVAGRASSLASLHERTFSESRQPLHRQTITPQTSQGLRHEFQRRRLEAQQTPLERWRHVGLTDPLFNPLLPQPNRRSEQNLLDTSDDDVFVGRGTASNRNSTVSSSSFQGDNSSSMQVDSSSSFRPLSFSSLPRPLLLNPTRTGPPATTQSRPSWREAMNIIGLGDSPSPVEDDDHLIGFNFLDNPGNSSDAPLIAPNTEERDEDTHASPFLPVPSLPSPNLDVVFASSTHTLSSEEMLSPEEPQHPSSQLRRQAILDRHRRELALLEAQRQDDLSFATRLERLRRGPSLTANRPESSVRSENPSGSGLHRTRTAVERSVHAAQARQHVASLRNAYERRLSTGSLGLSDSAPTRSPVTSTFPTSANTTRSTRVHLGSPPSSHVGGDPRYPSSSQSQSSQTNSLYSVTIDPDVFAPGPFRNTMRYSRQSQSTSGPLRPPQPAPAPIPSSRLPPRHSSNVQERYVQELLARNSNAPSSASSHAPTLPPFSFDNDSANGLHPHSSARDLSSHTSERTRPSMETSRPSASGLGSFFLSANRPEPGSQRRPSRFHPVPLASSPHAENPLSERFRPEISLQRFIQGRAQADNINDNAEGPVAPSQGPNLSRAESRYLNHAIEILSESRSTQAIQEHVWQQRASRFARIARGGNEETTGAGSRNPSMEDLDLSLEDFRRLARLRGGRAQSEAAFRRRGNMNLGDYMRDEDFDESYESLITLATQLGEVKPRHTPSQVIESLESAEYKDWATTDSDKRCPICLDDYEPSDRVLKLNNCSHWLHKDCLQQWLQAAATCPVCRKPVHGAAASSSSPRHRHFRPFHLHPPFRGPHRRQGPPDGPGGPSSSGLSTDSDVGGSVNTWRQR